MIQSTIKTTHEISIKTTVTVETKSSQTKKES